MGASDYVNAGVEGYGWGALSIHLLIRYLLGLHEQEAGVIKVVPVMPRALCRVGAAALGKIPVTHRVHLALEAGVTVKGESYHDESGGSTCC